MATPFDQSQYQVRFEWGAAGLARLAPADVVVVVDVLRFSSTVTDAVAAGLTVERAPAWSINGAGVAGVADAETVLLGCIRNASAVADAIVAVQDRRGQRTSVNVIAAGEWTPERELRFAVEDQLGAGAIISALSDRGIDHTSPEAAAAGESARGLKRAMRHLLGAAASGREIAAGVAATDAILGAGITPTSVADAADLDASTTVPVLQGDVYVAFA